MTKFALLFGALMSIGALSGCTTGAGSQVQTLSAAALPAGQGDAAFQQPYVDIDEWRDAPVRHRYVHGGFRGTDTRFSFYFPEKSGYQRRFFQHITPTPDNENLAQGNWVGEADKLSFAIASGAYFIETNGGGTGRIADGTQDPLITAYRANAATAQFSRVVAARLYGDHRPYGYAYGGSGGAYRTIGSIENTTGVWDGVVPYVPGSPMAIPNVFAVRMHAMRILAGKFPQIVDAMEPGGSGDPYAGLNAEQQAALREVTLMGFPPHSWFGYKTMGVHGFAAVYPGMVAADPGYFEDFWTKPGYLGFDQKASLARVRVQEAGTIAGLVGLAEGKTLSIVAAQADGGVDNAFRAGQNDGATPIAIRFSRTIQTPDFLGGDLVVTSGKAAGKSIPLSTIKGEVAVFGQADKAVLAQLAPGDAVRIDNSNFLAAQTYHRHQVPGPEFHAWDQFRKSDGTPIYPQRPALLAPSFTKAAGGALPTGRFQGKMIVVASLLDREAFPWQADWYRSKVTEHLGRDTDANFRLWYTENALHGDDPEEEDPTRSVGYLGILHQALRDLSAWVERGIVPAPSTGYRIADQQVIVPQGAAERQGVQPVVSLRANGGAVTTVKAGVPVDFVATAEAPASGGAIVDAAWNMTGGKNFPISAQSLARTGKRVEVRTRYSFTKPGVYFPTIRVIAQRNEAAGTPFAQLKNVARVRVIVR